MHVYYFITPISTGPGFNPGCSYITFGAKHLISQADPGSLFLDVSILSYSKQEWSILLDQAHCLVFAGNPRYNPSNVHSYWDYDIWDHIKQAQSRGILTADLWGGSAYPLPLKPIDVMATDMLTYDRNKHTLAAQSQLDLVTTRDPCAQLITSTVRHDAQLFPCSSYWASSFLNIAPTHRPYNCVTLRYIEGQPSVVKSLHNLSQVLATEKRTFFLCHAGFEYWWAKTNLPEIRNIICIFDPISLLKFYSMCDKVISMRLHGSIPALSLGCNVINVATDSRCLAFDNFGCSSVPYTALDTLPNRLEFHRLSPPHRPDPKNFLTLFRQKIVSRLDDASG